MLSPRAFTLAAMILVALLTRIMPHPPNFTAIGAMCLFGAAYFQNRGVALAAPLAALLLGDLILASSRYDFSSFPWLWMSYVLFGMIALVGMSLRGRVTAVRVTFTVIGVNVLYFLLSNGEAWLSGHAGQPLTPAGLMASYAAGIPFARNMILGDLFYSAILFGGYELISSQWTVLRRTPVRVRK